jgi:hypothetical protein
MENLQFIIDRFEEGNMAGFYQGGLAPIVKTFDWTKEKTDKELKEECERMFKEQFSTNSPLHNQP